MIDLTPLEVRKKKDDFERELRGYDRAQVQSFLDVVAERLEALVRENGQLRERSAQLSEAVENFRSRELAMNEALVSAQQLRGEIQERSEREAELIVREARAEGERLVEEARRRVEAQQSALERARSERDRFLRSYRTFLEGQLEEVALEEERGVRRRTGELNDGAD